MEIINTVKTMQVFSEKKRREGLTIAFVPTMGYLHDGHLALIREAKKNGDCTVVSIYVNPTQFGPNEDLSKYPRNFDRDSQLCGKEGVDVVFFPPDHEMYPPHYQTYVEVGEVTQNLCGLARPGHFRGVASVCAKLFNMVKPHVAVFGMKDYQQLVVIRTMVRDLNMDLEIKGMQTIREPDGLAMSSRNIYLKPEERESALSLSRSLIIAKDLFEKGERDSFTIIGKVEEIINSYPYTKIDYVQICDTTTMRDINIIEKGKAVIALAVRVGVARLIDNYVFGDSLELKTITF
jgi:pantoate--beta-alanine ligase